MKPTLPELKKLLETRFGGLLKSGSHDAHEKNGECCVRELTCVAFGLPWSDHPDGETASATDRASQILNDACWSSDKARTDGCLPLALLREADAAPEWWKNYTLETVRVILPPMLRKLAEVIPAHRTEMLAAADSCADAKNLNAAAARSAAYAAYAAYAAARSAYAAARSAAYAADAAYDAAYAAARSAAYAAARSAAYAAADDVLTSAVQLLIKCHRGDTI